MPAVTDQENPDRPAQYIALSKLPPLHSAALKLLSISDQSQSAMSDFEEVFKSDPALTADLLLVANSIEFGLRSRIETIRHALIYLGMKRVRNLSSTIAFSFYVRNVPRSAGLRSIWAHSVAAAVIAESLAPASDSSLLYTAGLTHDIGRLALFVTFPHEYLDLLSQEFSNVEEATAEEKSLFAITHCHAGSYVAEEWNFPENLRACIANHHGSLEPGSNTPPNLLRTACRMADHLGFPEVSGTDSTAATAWPEDLSNRLNLDPEELRERIQQRIGLFERTGTRR